ncbi:TolC family protein [Solitalea lacus]|uniref:TolC family protein n=1 Tax=Solitalea lacus TaxID=2911172 RepID=UPI001EDC2EA6|nr:TolC family protein [Solitalea lacus]UKJ09034.1 TolC family protein [Solitalea lacus]
MKQLIGITLLVLGLSTAQVKAQSTDLSLKDCLNYALANNQKLASTKMNEESGRYKTEEIRAQALPQINANANFTDNIIKQQMVLPGELVGKPGTVKAIEAGTTYNANAGIELSQQLFNQQVFTGLRAAKKSEEYYQLNTAMSEEDVIQGVSKLYYSVLVSQQKMDVVEANIKRVEQLVKTSASQYQNGLAKKIDLDRIKVNLTNLLTQRQELTNAITVQSNQLKYAMGMPIEQQVSFPKLDSKQIESQSANGLVFENLNINNRTEFKLLDKQSELLELQKKANISEYYPTISAFANYSYNGLSNEFDLHKSGGSATWFDMSSIGLRVRIPIFDGFARRSKINQTKVSIRQLDKTKEYTKLSFNMAHENAKIQLKNSLNTISSQKENVTLAEEVYKSTQNNYNLGLADLTDLLTAEVSLTEAQNNYSQALLNYKIAEIELIKSNGNLRTLLN